MSNKKILKCVAYIDIYVQPNMSDNLSHPLIGKMSRKGAPLRSNTCGILEHLELDKRQDNFYKYFEKELKSYD